MNVPEIKEFKTQEGKVFKCVYLGLSQGKKYFSSQGYVQCINKHYMKKNDSYVGYNSVMKCWTIGL